MTCWANPTPLTAKKKRVMMLLAVRFIFPPIFKDRPQILALQEEGVKPSGTAGEVIFYRFHI
jgi:hypothetical protein